MPGYVVERHGYTSAFKLVLDVVDDMLQHGFTQIVQQGGVAFNKATASAPVSTDSPFRVCLEAGGDVDPLNAASVSEKQPWRVMFDVCWFADGIAESLMCYVATPLQLGTAKGPAPERVQSGTQTQYVDIIGAVGDKVGTESSNSSAKYDSDTGNCYYGGPTGSTGDETTKGLINRTKRVGKSGASYPLSYRLVITPRGFWLGVWEDATTAQDATAFNWVLVQRPVDRNTGTVLTTGKCPVFCVNGSGGLFSQFVVREADILRPGKRRSAVVNSEDSEAILNSENQVALSEDGKYIVTFPSRLNTSRYRYPHELDMIGITSADVVSQNSDVPLTVYGESAARSYKAMHASGAANTGMRILVLQQGGGIS